MNRGQLSRTRPDRDPPAAPPMVVTTGGDRPLPLGHRLAVAGVVPVAVGFSLQVDERASYTLAVTATAPAGTLLGLQLVGGGRVLAYLTGRNPTLIVTLPIGLYRAVVTSAGPAGPVRYLIEFRQTTPARTRGVFGMSNIVDPFGSVFD